MLGASRRAAFLARRESSFVARVSPARRRYATSSELEKAKANLKQARQRARMTAGNAPEAGRAKRIQSPIASMEAIQEGLRKAIRAEGPIPVDRYMQMINDARPRTIGWHTGDLSPESLKNDWTSLDNGCHAYALAMVLFFRMNRDVAMSQRRSSPGFAEQTRLVLPFPGDFDLAKRIVSGLLLNDEDSSLRIIQIVEPNPTRRQANASALRRSADQWRRKMVLIEPGQVMPRPQRHELYFQWFRSLDEVPLMPDYWTMVFAHDYLSGLPARLIQRDDETNELHEACVTLAPDNPRNFALGLRTLPLDKTPWKWEDKRIERVPRDSLAVAPTELARVSQRLAEIVAGRSNASALTRASEQSAAEAQFTNLIVERSSTSRRRPANRGGRRRVDTDPGAAESMGGVGVFVEPTTSDLREIPQARTPGQAGTAFLMDRPGHGNLVAPVDERTFVLSVTNVSRLAVYEETLASFLDELSFPLILDRTSHWAPPEVMSSVEQMRFAGKKYSILALEAPPFHLEKHRQFVVERQKDEWAIKTGQVEQEAGEILRHQANLANEEFDPTLLPFNEQDIVFDKAFLERFDEKGELGGSKRGQGDADAAEVMSLSELGQRVTRRISYLSTFLGYFTLLQLTYLFAVGDEDEEDAIPPPRNS